MLAEINPRPEAKLENLAALEMQKINSNCIYSTNGIEQWTHTEHEWCNSLLGSDFN